MQNSDAVWAEIQALGMDPQDKNVLLARSKCYLLLGKADMAAQDAEATLRDDRSFYRVRLRERERNSAQTSSALL